MKNKNLKYFTVLACAMGILLFNSCTSFEAYKGGKKKSLNTETIDFYLPTFTNVEGLIELLVENEIIDDTSAFQAVLDYKSFTDDKIGAGKYNISPKTDYKTLINGFTKNSLGNGNKEVEVNLTFNNCCDIYDLAGKVSNQLELDSAAFIHYIFSDSILQKYGFTEERIGALFLPNTYRFYWDTDHIQFVARMAKEFKNFWTPERMEKLHRINLKSQSDVVTLASIVYQEQDKHPEEWPIIAGLYLNRLKKGMKLESDPTFRFCWGRELDGVERLTYKHRDRDCPYNTYIYAGLPPGPIYIPSAAVIDAVLNAENNNYIFMCAKPEFSGLHNFAKTLSQHNKNAKLFQNWLTIQQRNKR